MRNKIIWNLVNTVLAGMLVFLGACSDGNLTIRGILAALIAGLIVFITKFKSFWETTEKSLILEFFNFV